MGWKRSLGVASSLFLVSAAPAAPLVGGTDAPIAAAPVEPSLADAVPAGLDSTTADGATVRIIPPDPAAVARWCTAEQQGAHRLADQLRRRERELDEEGRSLTLRESELKVTEARLDARMAELARIRTEIGDLFVTADAESAARLAGVVKMVEANRASEAAPILAALEPDLAVQVLNRMSPQKAGKLLAELAPGQAAALAEQLVRPLVVPSR